MTNKTFLCFLLLLAGFCGGSSWAQSFEQGELTTGMQELENLSGYWYTEDREELRQIPFTEEENQLNLVKPIKTRPSSRLPDTLYLYFEGVAWRAEIYLNDRLLAITKDPFQEYLFPIPQSLLNTGENLLVVRMKQEGPSIDFYPDKFIGIYRPCYLLAPTGTYGPVVKQKVQESASKVLIYAPWSPETGFLPDTGTFSQALDTAIALGSQYVHYAFEPPSSYKRLAAKKGIIRVESLAKCDSVAFLNTYPILGLPRNVHPWFWLDEKGERSEVAGTYQSWKKAKFGLAESPNRVFLLIFLLVPLLGLVLLKFVGPKTWSFLLDYLIKVKFFLDLIRNGKFLKNLSSILINLYGLILMAVCISIFLYFLQASGRIETLNILSAESLLFRIMLNGGFSLPELFLGALVFLVVLAGLKSSISYTFSLLYGINTLTPTLQNLEIISTFPLNILLMLPTGALFFIQPELAWASAIVWQILFLIILLRKVITQYAGLSYIFQFSATLKILYICGLEIMPWVLLV